MADASKPEKELGMSKKQTKVIAIIVASVLFLGSGGFVIFAIVNNLFG